MKKIFCLLLIFALVGCSDFLEEDKKAAFPTLTSIRQKPVIKP